MHSYFSLILLLKYQLIGNSRHRYSEVWKQGSALPENMFLLGPLIHSVNTYRAPTEYMLGYSGEQKSQARVMHDAFPRR